MAKKVSDGTVSRKTNKQKKVTSIGKSTFSRPQRRKCDKKRGVKKYRGQGK